MLKNTFTKNETDLRNVKIDELFTEDLYEKALSRGYTPESWKKLFMDYMNLWIELVLVENDTESYNEAYTQLIKIHNQILQVQEGQ